MLAGGGGGEPVAGSTYINPETYGMKAVGVDGADAATNTAALQNALAAGPVMLPPKSYELNGITFTGSFTLKGTDKRSALIFQTGVAVPSQGTAALYVPIPTANIGTVIENLTFYPAAANTISHGMIFSQTAGPGYMSNFRIDGVIMNLSLPFTTTSIYLENNMASPDGFFTGVIQNCLCTTGTYAGIAGTNIGDSIIIRKNVVNNGLGVAIRLSSVAGARQVVIEDNNLTSRNGQIYLVALGQCSIFRNWMEHPAYLGEFVGGATVKAQVTLENCYMCDVSYCTIVGGSGQPGPDGVTPVNGSSYGVYLIGTTQLSLVGPRNWIAAVGISKIQDVSSSGTNSALSTGVQANVLA
ncbi:hypothetical protein RLEG12_18665 [Rhizobium leguminosarum bv. trifolii CB782]|nr:hypothetical protein RLEG12_18665 [Rhizobium leguminosarum bv. trifolii CB782]